MNNLFIAGILGKLISFYALTMLPPLAVSLYRHDGAAEGFALSATITFLSGAIAWYKGSVDETNLKIREGYIAVLGVWLLASLYGTLPFILTGSLSSFTDALFESVSGHTATGATVIADLEKIPDSILLWRSIMHWLGGMGIVVLFIAVLPNLGVNAFYLFQTEASGPSTEKIVPRIRDTALALWSIYVFFTLIQFGFLLAFNMPVFDAVNHALSTMGTGGFSIKNSSISFYANPAFELITIFFMVLSGGSYALYFQASRKGLGRIYKDTEFRVYLSVIVFVSLAITIDLTRAGVLGFEHSLVKSLFQVSAVITTTGFISANYEYWPPFSKTLLFILMFVGGCAGSTSSGIKISRYIILVKACWAELKKLIHPRVVTSIHIDNKPVDSSVVRAVLIFFFMYMLTFVIALVLVNSTADLEHFNGISIVAATLGNVGIGFGLIGPAGTFATLSDSTKLISIVCMILGRLELFTVLVFLRPEFWRGQRSW